MKKPRLVPDARQGWRWISTRAMALNLAGLTTWLALPDDLKSTIPDQWVMFGAVVVTAAGLVGRFIDQGGDDAAKDR